MRRVGVVSAGRAAIRRLRGISALAGRRTEPRGNMLNELLALSPQLGDIAFEPIDKPAMFRAMCRGIAMAQVAEAVAQHLQLPPFERQHHDLLANLPRFRVTSVVTCF
jgi:hypothetical protein